MLHIKLNIPVEAFGRLLFKKASEGVNSQVPRIWVGPYVDGALENLIKLSAEGENANKA